MKLTGPAQRDHLGEVNEMVERNEKQSAAKAGSELSGGLGMDAFDKAFSDLIPNNVFGICKKYGFTMKYKLDGESLCFKVGPVEKDPAA